MRGTILTPQEITTVNYYDQHAEEWSEKHSGGTMFDPEMDLLFQLVPEGKILEVGTGSGEDAFKLISHYGLNNYYGCDVSGGLLRIARKNNPGANLAHASIYELKKLNQKFDGFWISAMLIHVPKNKLSYALKCVYDVVIPGGMGFISVMEGSVDMEESRPGRYYSLWMPDEFEKEIKDAKFDIAKSRRIMTSASPWLAYILRRV